MTDNIKQTLALSLILEEYNKATTKHPTPFNSAHEGAAIIREEHDEFWDEIKADNPEKAQKEVAQLGAMCLRFLMDVSAKTASTEQTTDFPLCDCGKCRDARQKAGQKREIDLSQIVT